MAIGFVGGAFSTGSVTAGTSKTITYSPAANNTLVVFGFGAGALVSNVTDTAGNKYYQRVSPVSNTTEATCWSTNAGKSVAGTSITITVTFALSVRNTCVIVEYSGVTGIGKVVTATGSSTTPAASLAIQNANNVLVVGVSVESTSTYALATGTALRESQAGAGATTPGGGVVDNTSASAGTLVTCSATITTGAWVASGLELTTLSGVDVSDDASWTYTPPVAQTNAQARNVVLGFASQGAASSLVTDEDQWRNPLSPLLFANFPAPFVFDAGELAAPAVSALDDGGWTYATIAQQQAPSVQLGFGAQGTASSLVTDEDYWDDHIGTVVPTVVLLPPFVFDAGELAAPLVSALDDGTAPVVPLSQQLVLAYPAPWQFEQDDPSSLSGQPDEDLWRNSVVQVQATNVTPAPWQFEQSDPSSLSGQPDEDLWQNGAAPTQLTLVYLAPWQFEQSDPSSLSGQPDEDLWQNGVAPTQLTLAYPAPWQFEQDGPTTLSGQPDEDFCALSAPAQLTFAPFAFGSVDDVTTVQPSTFVPDEDCAPPLATYQQLAFAWALPYAFDAGEHFVTLDEDYFAALTAPVQLPLACPAPWQFEQDDPTTLRGQPDEDFWVSGVAPVPASNLAPAPWQFEQHDPSSLSGQPEEELWRNAVAPVQLSFGRLYLPETEELSAATLYGQPDEDFWVNATVPVQATNAVPASWLFDPSELDFVNVEEELWQNGVVPVCATNFTPAPWQFEQHDISVTPHGQVDEDFWDNAVNPVQLTLAWPAPWQFEQDEYSIPPPPLHVEEEFWNVVAPLMYPATTVLLGFSEQGTAGHSALNEDYWDNLVNLVQFTLGPAYLPDPEYVAPPQLYASDDYWNVPTPLFFAPTTTLLNFPQQGKASQSALDEDFWDNAVNPVPLTFGPLYRPDPEELSAHLLRGQPDEDFFAPAGYAPSCVQLAFAWPAPWQFEQNDRIPPPIMDELFQAPLGYAPSNAAQNLPLPIWASEQNDPGTLRGQLDEDFFAPAGYAPSCVQLAFAWPAPWQFEQDDTTSLNGQPDEDFWQNRTAPVVAANLVPNPAQFEQHDTALLHGTLDDYVPFGYAPSCVATTFLYPSPFVFDQHEPPPLRGLDEGLPVLARPCAFCAPFGNAPAQWAFDAGELAADTGSHDEVYWARPGAPCVPFGNAPLQPWAFDAGEFAHTGAHDEDYWWRVFAPFVSTNVRPTSPTLLEDERCRTTPTEDYWGKMFSPPSLDNRIPSMLALQDDIGSVRLMRMVSWITTGVTP